jgi:stage V sporulation protein S
MSQPVIRVAANSHPNAVAGAIAGQLRTQGQTFAQAIGPHAVNQMLKAASLAGRFLSEEGRTLVCIPTFTQTSIEGKERTAIRLYMRCE